MESAVDYVSLENALVSQPITSMDSLLMHTVQKGTLNDLGKWFIDPSEIHFDPDYDVVFGGYGDLHKATYDGNADPIAVKKLRPAGNRKQRLRVAAVRAYAVPRVQFTNERFQAFARELRTWERANHPNVLRLVGFYLDQNNLYSAWLITWWQQEGDILGYIDRTKPDMEKRLKLVRWARAPSFARYSDRSHVQAQDTAEGLAYLHSCDPPICHSDIKPVGGCVSRTEGRSLTDCSLRRIRSFISADERCYATSVWQESRKRLRPA